MSKLFAFFTGGWIGPLVGVVALLGSLWAGYAYIVHSARSEGRAEVQKQWDADTQARALLVAAAAEEKRIKEQQHAIDLETERKHRAADGVAVGLVLGATRAELERLRNATSTVAGAGEAAGDPAAGPGTETAAARIGIVFNECAGRLVEMAETTEQLGIRLRGLQAWADSAVEVCGK
jgi:hypothetical protein